MTIKNIRNTNNSSLLIIWFVLFFLIQSCGTHKNGGIQTVVNQNNSIPVKILIYDVAKDSSLIRLYVPIEFDLINNYNYKIELASGYFSIKGGNVQSGSIDLLINNKLKLALRNIKFDKGEKKHFKAYTSHKLLISNEEKEKVLEGAKFAQHMFSSKKEVYNIGELKNAPLF